MAAKRKWREPTKIVSIRLEPAKLEEIKEVFGGLQAWIDICIEALDETKRNKYEQIKAKIPKTNTRKSKTSLRP